MEQLLGHFPEMYDDRYMSVLGPHEQRVIPFDQPSLLSAAEAYDEFKFGAPLRVVITAAQKQFYVFTMCGVPYAGSPKYNYMQDASFLVTDDAFGTSSERGFVEVRTADDWVTFGRSYQKERFEYPGTVSARHFQISCDDEGNLYVRNLYPLHRTTLCMRAGGL